jgi:hypothetical protein
LFIYLLNAMSQRLAADTEFAEFCDHVSSSHTLGKLLRASIKDFAVVIAHHHRKRQFCWDIKSVDTVGTTRAL